MFQSESNRNINKHIFHIIRKHYLVLKAFIFNTVKKSERVLKISRTILKKRWFTYKPFDCFMIETIYMAESLPMTMPMTERLLVYDLISSKQLRSHKKRKKCSLRVMSLIDWPRASKT